MFPQAGEFKLSSFWLWGDSTNQFTQHYTLTVHICLSYYWLVSCDTLWIGWSCTKDGIKIKVSLIDDNNLPFLTTHVLYTQNFFELFKTFQIPVNHIFTKTMDQMTVSNMKVLVLGTVNSHISCQSCYCFLEMFCWSSLFLLRLMKTEEVTFGLCSLCQI